MTKRLEEVEEENAKLKATVEKMEELRVLGQHSAVMECEASDTFMARDRAEAKLAKLSEELTSFRAMHTEL